MATDVGYILFVQLLGMTQYPGSPFTGNIFRDLIMFLVVPTIFIIMILYIVSGRIIPDRNFRIMLGVGAYLFIIVSGYYQVFALLAGPYFFFLIFILGLVGFILRHFQRGPGTFGGGGGFSSGHGNRFKTFARPVLDPGRRKYLESEINHINKEIIQKEKSLEILREKGSTHGIGDIEAQLTGLRRERKKYEDELEGRTE